MAGAPDIVLGFEEEGPDTNQLVQFLMDEERRAEDGTLQEEREVALDFYNGEPFGDEVDGRSQLVTRDVAEVVDYMTVSLLRTMVSGDKVVEFDCSEPPQPIQKDERGNPIPRAPTMSEQATIAVTREFFQGQDGYRLIHDWIKAGLLEKASTAKVCVEPRSPKRREAVLSIEEMTALSEQGVELIASSQMDEAGQQWAAAWLEPQPPRFRDYVVPNEEFGVASDARDLDDDCVYCGYKMRRTISDIAKMGYDVEEIYDTGTENLNALSRARDGGVNDSDADYRTGANRAVWFMEEYARFDLNGDGIAELLKVHRVGQTILDIDEVEDQPGVVWCPFPMPGRIVGQSLADKVMDIQRTRSVLLRQGMDNLFQTNNPRWLVHEGSTGDNTIDDLLSSDRPGGITRYAGNIPPMAVTLPFAAQSAFEVMEVLNGEKESRTGITRLNQGLDADALNKTATGTALMQAQGQQMEEYLARNFAEAFARLMLKKYRLMRQFGQPIEVVIDDQAVTIDPRQWPDDMNVMVRVGLGSGRKEQRVQYRTMLLEIMQAAMQGGSRVFTDANLYANVKGLIADANLGNARELATDPDSLPPAQEQPDPEMVKVEADAKIKAAEADRKREEANLNIELQRQESDARIEFMRDEAAVKLDLEERRAASEEALALRQQDFEMAMAREQMELQREQAEHRATLAEQDAVSKKRPGGDLDK